jgi:hypothetical protein
VSRAVTVLLFVLSVAVTSMLDSVAGAWKLLIALGAGSGLVLILRFLWWRINAASEISAMVASLVFSLAFGRLLHVDNGAEKDALVMLLTVACSTAVWLTVTLLTRPEDDDVLRRFVQRVRPFGPGWASVYARLGLPPPVTSWRRIIVGFFSGVVLVYASMFGIGAIVLGEAARGLALLALAGAAFALCAWGLGLAQQQAQDV